MEFEQCSVRCLESEEEEKEVVSLRYFLTENAGLSVKRENSTTNHHDAFFEFAHSNSTAYKFCPAEEQLFHQDRIFPQQFSSSKSKSEHENHRLLNGKLDAWRTDSLGTKSSFISSNSQASQKRGFHSSSETVFWRSKSRFQADRRTKPPNLARKTRMKWLQFFTGGLITTPPLNLQELRLKQGKPKNSVFKRSVSDEGLVTWRKEVRAVNVGEKSMSVKESIVSKGLNILTPVINCLSVGERGSGEGNQMDQNSGKSKKGGARVHPTPLVRARKRSRWIFPKLLLHWFWP